MAPLLVVMALVGGCAETQLITHAAKRVEQARATEPVSPVYKIGNPYQIDGVWYYPAEDYAYDETGIASWYGPDFDGRPTANGEVYDMNGLSAAHRTLPMPSFVRVTNLENGRSLALRVNDRGPYARGRIIDLSRRAAQLLGFERSGTARVRVQIMADESRAVVARIRGRTNVAAVDSPITVARLPKTAVSAEALPPPDGAQVASDPTASSRPRLLAGPAPSAATAPPPAEPRMGEVTIEAVRPTSIFVQAGAFAQYENANRVRARLASSVGGVSVSSVLVGGRDLFRVRIGPLPGVNQADDALARVIAAGYPEARIVVD